MASCKGPSSENRLFLRPILKSVAVMETKTALNANAAYTVQLVLISSIVLIPTAFV